MSGSIETILFELRAQLKTDEAKTSLDELGAKIKAVESGSAPEIKFRGIAELKGELASLGQIRDKAIDFPTAKEAAAKIKTVENEIATLESKLKAAGESSHSAFSKIKESAGGAASSLGGLVGAGALVGGAGLGLEKLFEAGEKRIKSLEDQRTALRQAGIAEGDLGSAQKEAGKVTDELSEKYAKSKGEIRAIQTTVAGLGGISGEQAKKVSEIGLAFEQLGVPAKAFKAILAGSGSDEAKGAIQSLGEKVPSLRKALEGAGTAGEKVEAVFKGLAPTLAGMKEAADGPLGAFEKVKNNLAGTAGKIGESLIQVVGPIAKVLLPVVQVLGDTITSLVGDLEGAFAPLGSLFGGAGKSADGFKEVVKEVSLLLTGGLKVSFAVIGGVVKEFVKTWNDVSDSVAAIGNIFKGSSGSIDTANNTAARSIEGVKAAFDEYGKTIDDVDQKIAAAKGAQDQVAQLEALQSKQKLTGDEQITLGKLTEELGRKFPEATSGVNTLTGAFEVNTEKLKALSKEQKAYADASLKKNINENILGPMGDLVPAIAAQKEKLADLRKQLDAAISSNNRDKIIELRDAYVKQGDAVKASEEQLKKNTEVLVKNGLVGTGTAEDMAKAFHTTTDQVATLVPIVKEINEGLEKQAADAKKVEASVAGIAASFDTAKKAADQEFAQSKSALAHTYLVEAQLREQRKTGAISEAEFQKQNAANEAEYNDLLKQGLQHKHEAKLVDDAAKSGAADLTDETKKAVKEKEKAVPVAELIAKLDQDHLTAMLTEQDHGELTEKSKAQIAAQEKAGLASVLSVIQAEELRVGKLKQTAEVQKELADLQDKEYTTRIKISQLGATLAPKVDPGAIKAANEAIEGSLAEFNKWQLDLSRQLRDAQIANSHDADEKELATLLAKQARELDYFNDRRATGAHLTQLEVDLENEILKRQDNERAALLKKRRDKEVDDAKKSFDQIAGAFTDAFSKSIEDNKKLTGKDLAEKEHGFNSELDAARRSYSQGESDYKTYQERLKQISSERTAFEARQHAGANKVFVDGLKGTFAGAKNAVSDYLIHFAEKKIEEAAINAAIEAEKTGASAAGQAARGVIAAAETVADLAVAAGKGVAAAASAAFNAIVALPFPVDLIAAGASVAAVAGLIGGLTGLIKFETGGLGLVGEKGPEIIGPTKDFSQFASQLIAESMRKTEQIMKNENQSGAGRRGSGQQNIKIEGKLTGKTRDLQIALTKEKMSSGLEKVGS